jgi:hypothetical protein
MTGLPSPRNMASPMAHGAPLLQPVVGAVKSPALLVVDLEAVWEAVWEADSAALEVDLEASTQAVVPAHSVVDSGDKAHSGNLDHGLQAHGPAGGTATGTPSYVFFSPEP